MPFLYLTKLRPAGFTLYTHGIIALARVEERNPLVSLVVLDRQNRKARSVIRTASQPGRHSRVTSVGYVNVIHGVSWASGAWTECPGEFFEMLHGVAEGRVAHLLPEAFAERKAPHCDCRSGFCCGSVQDSELFQKTGRISDIRNAQPEEFGPVLANRNGQGREWN